MAEHASVVGRKQGQWEGVEQKVKKRRKQKKVENKKTSPGTRHDSCRTGRGSNARIICNSKMLPTNLTHRPTDTAICIVSIELEFGPRDWNLWGLQSH